MKILITMLALSAVASTKLNAQKTEETRKAPIIATADELAITVLNLRRPISSDKETIGTGSFISKGNDLYIVTAAHVAKNMDDKAYIIIQGPNNTPIEVPLTELSSDIKWKDHPEADLSVLKLDPSPEVNMKYLQGRFIPYGIIDTEQNSVPRNTQLTILGFPHGLGAQKHFSPLSFRTFPSSGLLTMGRFDTTLPQTFILLENPSMGGYSGGPVYDLSIIESGGLTMRGTGTKLHGFIHGTLGDTTGGKLAAVTPAYYLADLI